MGQAVGQKPDWRDVSGEIGAHPDTPCSGWRNIWAALSFVNTKYCVDGVDNSGKPGDRRTTASGAAAKGFCGGLSTGVENRAYRYSASWPISRAISSCPSSGKNRPPIAS